MINSLTSVQRDENMARISDPSENLERNEKWEEADEQGQDFFLKSEEQKKQERKNEFKDVQGCVWMVHKMAHTSLSLLSRSFSEFHSYIPPILSPTELVF